MPAPAPPGPSPRRWRRCHRPARRWRRRGRTHRRGRFEWFRRPPDRPRFGDRAPSTVPRVEGRRTQTLRPWSPTHTWPSGFTAISCGGDGLQRRARDRTVGRSLVRVPLDERPLHDSDLDPDPYVQFSRWFDDAVGARSAAARRDDRGDRDARRPTVGPHGVAARGRRARVLLLHQLRESQGPRARRQSACVDRVPLARGAPAGAGDRPGRARERRGGRRVLVRASTRRAV